MAIYNIFDYSEKEKMAEKGPFPFSVTEKVNLSQESAGSKKDRFFSSVAARLFFLLLLLVDVLWGMYSIMQFFLSLVLNVVTLFKVPLLQKKLKKTLLSIRRFVICGLSLLIAIFSPSLGILFSCMYFMMYDKEGIEEVVPASLRDQFKEFFQ